MGNESYKFCKYLNWRINHGYHMILPQAAERITQRTSIPLHTGLRPSHSIQHRLMAQIPGMY